MCRGRKILRVGRGGGGGRGFDMLHKRMLAHIFNQIDMKNHGNVIVAYSALALLLVFFCSLTNLKSCGGSTSCEPCWKDVRNL